MMCKLVRISIVGSMLVTGTMTQADEFYHMQSSQRIPGRLVSIVGDAVTWDIVCTGRQKTFSAYLEDADFNLIVFNDKCQDRLRFSPAGNGGCPKGKLVHSGKIVLKNGRRVMFDNASFQFVDGKFDGRTAITHRDVKYARDDIDSIFLWELGCTDPKYYDF